MSRVHCNQCAKELNFEYNPLESISYNGAVAQDAGIVYKNTVLYSGVDESLFFCNKTCQQTYYKEYGWDKKLDYITDIINEEVKENNFTRMSNKAAQTIIGFLKILSLRLQK